MSRVMWYVHNAPTDNPRSRLPTQAPTHTPSAHSDVISPGAITCSSSSSQQRQAVEKTQPLSSAATKPCSCKTPAAHPPPPSHTLGLTLNALATTRPHPLRQLKCQPPDLTTRIHPFLPSTQPYHKFAHCCWRAQRAKRSKVEYSC
eukprot:174991-Chlamydomonas_euryale.AAC.1